MSQNSTSIILADGAWADGSSWAKVVMLLEQQAFEVVAAPLPLTSLSTVAAAFGLRFELPNYLVELYKLAARYAFDGVINNVGLVRGRRNRFHHCPRWQGCQRLSFL